MLIFAKLLENLSHCYYPRPGGDSVVGIETRYGLDGPGIEFGEDEIFRTRPDRPWGSPSS